MFWTDPVDARTALVNLIWRNSLFFKSSNVSFSVCIESNCLVDSLSGVCLFLSCFVLFLLPFSPFSNDTMAFSIRVIHTILLVSVPFILGILFNYLDQTGECSLYSLSILSRRIGNEEVYHLNGVGFFYELWMPSFPPPYAHISFARC